MSATGVVGIARVTASRDLLRTLGIHSNTLGLLGTLDIHGGTWDAFFCFLLLITKLFQHFIWWLHYQYPLLTCFGSDTYLH